MRIAVVAGTNREGSQTLRLATQLAERYRQAGATVTLLDLRGLPPGIATPGAYAEKPDGFNVFADAVLEADGLCVVTPEYNGGMPGILKLFIDMLPFPASFHHRPVCFVGTAAGMWGALRPVEQLQAVFGYRNAHVFPDRVFLPRVSVGLDDQGWPTDPAVAALLTRQTTDFVAFCAALAPLRLPAV